MLDFLESIVETLEVIISVVVNLITSIVGFAQMLPQALGFITAATGLLPPFVLPFVMASISLSILFMFIGRN